MDRAAAADTCCASCGISQVDDVKLKKCDGGCDLVKYCSDECQGNHKEQHEEECKKRAGELRDRDLFEQPERSHLGDCPICCLPLSLDGTKSSWMGCCSKLICNGCNYANQMRERKEGLKRRCAYCREPLPNTDEEFEKYRMERIKKNDPAAMCEVGKERYYEGDYKTALECLTQAAELGIAEAHYGLSVLYRDGEGVEKDEYIMYREGMGSGGVEKDEKKEIYHLEEAAIGGHPGARHNLGCFEARSGRFERAREHFIIASNLGDHDSLSYVKRLYAEGNASKEDYFDALRAYQVAVYATKSAERGKAEAYFEALGARRS